MKKYLITDPTLYPPSHFFSLLESAFQRHSPNIALLRGYDAQEFASSFISLCHRYNVLAFISGNLKIAIQKGFDGVHFKSTQIQQLKEKPDNILSFYSAHSLQDILSAQQYCADAVTLSPIFKTPNKGEPLGIQYLVRILHDSRINIDIFALGGILSHHIHQLQNLPLAGFAAIRYFADLNNT
ncbi:hypothetical protein CCZ01_05305 [Helicobacter monodelphidis]|uniref:thiamine phosphate synthase n=1 Tax=Helicobacter sp. 15-1451 TaxID=2004995 RepID=UPI000DCEDC70|nr:thiamine phosphate synthase [Helicobacter sp. 15-1451]RAX57704.1 hypothetical protein CCZ01_05305 [Helicobacter sp. 15-1451]